MAFRITTHFSRHKKFDVQITAVQDKIYSLGNIYSESKFCSRIRFFVYVGVQYILEKQLKKNSGLFRNSSKLR